MSDTEQKPKPAEDLRRSKRNKFHLDIVAVLSRRSPDFRRSTSKSDSSKSTIKAKPVNAVRRSIKPSGDVPVLEPIFPLDAEKALVKIESSTPEDLVKQSNNSIENGVARKRQKFDETNSVSSIENSNFLLVKQDAIKLEPKPTVQHKIIRCYKCLTTFKTNAGLGKHVKTCKKFVDSTRASWPTRLPDLSNASGNSSLTRTCSSANNTPSNSSSSNAAIKKESDSDSLEDSTELDMPILTPECSLKPRKARIIANIRPLPAASSPASIQEKRSRLKRNRAPASLQAPFDIKKALSLKLEIPPVPKIIVESPIDKNLDHFCSKCPYRTGDKNLLLLHEALHDTNGPRSYQCTFCSYSSFSPNALHYHLNLHAPTLSPNTAVSIRKHIIANKRNGVHNEVFTPTTSSVVQRLEQVQTQQQRLVSIIKRSGGDEHTSKRIKIQLPLPSTKFYTCKKCSFKTERKENLTFHEELHGSNLLYSCKHCDYSSNAKTVVEYHMRNHHFLETSLTTHATNLAISILKKKAQELDRRCSSVPLEADLTVNPSAELCPNLADTQSLATNDAKSS